MRTADDFNRYYATPDPWGISRATFRDRVLGRHLTRSTRNKSVLELGCGEGHLTRAIFRRARSVTSVDISDVAIARAKSLNLRNARFETADLLDVSFGGYDVIAAIECIHFLSHHEQGIFLERIAREHSGKLLLLSGPIIDYQHHFGHRRLLLEFQSSWIYGRQISQSVGLLAPVFIADCGLPAQIAARLQAARSAT